MANANDKTFPGGRNSVFFTGSLNYNDTTAKNLFALPANCYIVGGQIVGYYSAASNATAATISVGISADSGGAGNEYLNKWSVATATGSNFQSNVPFTRFGAQASNSWTVGSSNNWTVGSNSFLVSGAVTGTVGAGAGPWDVIFEVIPE